MEIKVSTYTWAIVAYKDTDRLQAYLYDHTSVADFPEYSIGDSFRTPESPVVCVLRTDVYGTQVSGVSELCDRATSLQLGQLDRLSSGLIRNPGQGYNSRREAVEAGLDALR